jgi:hypothetical protein
MILSKCPKVLKNAAETVLDGITLTKRALVYFSGPWKNILSLRQCLKIILFQNSNKTNLT